MFTALIRIPGDWKKRFRTTSYSNTGDTRNGVPGSSPTSRSHAARPSVSNRTSNRAPSSGSSNSFTVVDLHGISNGWCHRALNCRGLPSPKLR
ncbi:hypothetical protein ACIGXI_23180 [Kitasatospora aureofaciens]|uniref:hypothetical protein n=1 Tax=Kitasatospora aureofaciens TaxID=1894 RepID=UPI0037C70102